MSKQSASDAVTDLVALATHFVVYAPMLGFRDVLVTILCVSSEQPLSNRSFFRLSHVLNRLWS